MMKAFLRNLAVFLAGIFFSGLTAQGQEPLAQTNKLEEPRIPLIQMMDVPLEAALINMARQAELNIVVDWRIINANRIPTGNTNLDAYVNLRWENLTANQALTRLLGERELFMVKNPQTGVAKISLTNAPPRMFSQELLDASRDIVPRIRMENVSLDTALNSLAEKSKLKLEFIDELKDQAGEIYVSLDFEKLTTAQALAALCDQYDLRITRVRKSSTWRIFLGK